MHLLRGGVQISSFLRFSAAIKSTHPKFYSSFWPLLNSSNCRQAKQAFTNCHGLGMKQYFCSSTATDDAKWNADEARTGTTIADDDEEEEGDDAEDKSAEAESGKKEERGVKGASKSAKGPKELAQRITLKMETRGKRNKAVTVVRGLGTCGIDLKKASKFFAIRFACGCKVAGLDELVIQGDFKDVLFEVIPEKWNVSKDVIEDIGEGQKK